jgi:hypothetical protein
MILPVVMLSSHLMVMIHTIREDNRAHEAIIDARVSHSCGVSSMHIIYSITSKLSRISEDTCGPHEMYCCQDDSG